MCNSGDGARCSMDAATDIKDCNCVRTTRLEYLRHKSNHTSVECTEIHKLLRRTLNRSQLLIDAVASKNKHLVELLLKYGVSASSKDKSGESALHYALERGSYALARALLKRGASIDDVNRYGLLPLEMAFQKGLPAKFLRLLIKYGAKPDIVNFTSYACRANDDVIGPLYRYIDIAEFNHQGHLPLHLAARLNHNQGVSALLARGAPVNERSLDGDTALHLAAEQAMPRCVQLLLLNGANPKLRDGRGQTVLARLINNHKFCQYLRSVPAKKIDMLLTVNSDLDDDLLRTGLRMSKSSVRVLLKHIVGSGRHKEQFDDEKTWPFKCEEMRRYYDSCAAEVELMGRRRLFRDVTLHDFLAKSLHRLAAYTDHPRVKSQMNKKNLQKKFPIYTGVIYKRYTAARERRRAVKRASNALGEALGIGFGNDHPAVHKILDFFTKEEMQSLLV